MKLLEKKKKKSLRKLSKDENLIVERFSLTHLSK